MIKEDPKNYRKHGEKNKALIADSLKECGAGRSILIDNDDVIIAGNGVYEQAAKQNIPIKVIETDGTELIAVKRTDLSTEDSRRKKLAAIDNAASDLSEWDMEAMKGEFTAAEFEKMGIELDFEMEGKEQPEEIAEEEDIRCKEAEFRKRMEAGEDMTEDEEYLEFLEKFKLKKTTDDCYTPALVYDAVADWVANKYGVKKSAFVRPFYPGGDYKKFKYPKGCVVVDNPPFSIEAEILSFYKEQGVRFFLFAPSLTLFSSSSSAAAAAALCCGVSITYDNGANVSTSFLTNLEDRAVRFKSEPTLYKAVKEANDRNLKEQRRELPKYAYPDNIITAPFVARLSKYGVDYSVSVLQSCAISSLDSQKASGKTIYGKGYIVSEKAAAEKAAAEKAAAEKAAATRWQLSEREKAIVAKLSIND